MFFSTRGIDFGFFLVCTDFEVTTMQYLAVTLLISFPCLLSHFFLSRFLKKRILAFSLPDMGLPDLADNLAGLLQGVQHLCGLLPALPNVLGLAEQQLDLVLFVQAGHQLTLQVVLWWGEGVWDYVYGR